MRISIAERLRPFSHLPGTVCCLPGSPYEFRFYPTRIEFRNLLNQKCAYSPIDLQLHGPVRDFTVQQDLEKGRLLVWGHYREGFVRYHICLDPAQRGVIFQIERCPEEGVQTSFSETALFAKQSVYLIENADPFQMAKPNTRLSLGCHKAQDWDLVKRRGCLEEIFPFWFRLGMLSGTIGDCQSDHPLIRDCAQKILDRDKLSIYEAFKKIFLGGFAGILSPRLQDESFQGIVPSLYVSNELSPFILLSEAAYWISRLFIEIKQNSLSFLPALPPQFHSGRMIDFLVPFGTIDLEWSKKTLRRLAFKSNKNTQLSFIFPKQIKGFRFRTHPKDKGSLLSVGTPLDFQENEVYFFDNFTH